MAQQPPELGVRAQVLEVVPPGPIHRNRRTAIAKFSHRIPNFKEPGTSYSLVRDPKALTSASAPMPVMAAPPVGESAAAAQRRKEATVSRLRPSAAAAAAAAAADQKAPLLLEQRGPPPPAGSAPAPSSGPNGVTATFKGAPEAGGGANVEGPPLHYVLFRAPGGRITAFPADQWYAFKPHVDRRGLVDSTNAATAAAAPVIRAGPGRGGGRGGGRGAGGGDGSGFDLFASRLVPKSQRLEKQRRDEEAREKAEAVASGQLPPMLAADDDMGSSRLKRLVEEDDLENELFGDDEEDEGPGRFGRNAKGPGKKGKARGGGEDLADDEVPEDLYGGADDELRPERPQEAEDWEHEFAPDDDDQDQGADDEVYDDDPGMRKKLGIEDDEDEGEEADEQARKLKKLGDPDDDDEEEEEERKRKEAEEAAKAAAASASAAGGDDEDEGEDEGEEDLDELDEMDEDAKPPSQRPAPPAPAPAPAAVAPAAAGGVKRKAGAEEPRPTADAQAQAAKRARTATPPPAQAAAAAAATVAATKPAAAAKPAAAPAAKPAAAAGAAAAPAAGGAQAVTAEEVTALLRSRADCMMPFQEFMRHFSKRTSTPELRTALKELTMSLCRSSKNEQGVLMVTLKGK